MSSQNSIALWQLQCKATPKDAAKLSAVEIKNLFKQLPDWQLINTEGVNQLQKRFAFKNFVEAINFSNHLSKIAEQNDHHPALLVEYGQVTVTWWSRSISGLHQNDFVMAAKTDRVYLSNDR
jgi:4a-hydroxytetrahydrobiopterin dehydratase